MPRYKLFIEYDGTNYCGWQKQPEDRTVEGEIERALSQLFQKPVDIIGQGRTDSGVHAEAQVAHVDLPKKIVPDELLSAFLGTLPRDIAVWKIEEAAADFHARFGGKSRQYRYQIITRPSPLYERFAERVFTELNLEAMKQCAEMIKGIHDFESFTYSTPEQKSATCEILYSQFTVEDPLIIYRIKANRFVRHLVRRLVGTMIQVGLGKRSVDYFTDLLEYPNTEKSGHGASAKGLILEKVEY